MSVKPRPQEPEEAAGLTASAGMTQSTGLERQQFRESPPHSPEDWSWHPSTINKPGTPHMPVPQLQVAWGTGGLLRLVGFQAT